MIAMPPTITGRGLLAASFTSPKYEAAIFILIYFKFHLNRIGIIFI